MRARVSRLLAVPDIGQPPDRVDGNSSPGALVSNWTTPYLANMAPPSSPESNQRPVAPASTGSALRRARKDCGLSQMQLAELAGITRQSLYAIEQGKAQPSVGVALRLARTLGGSVEQLFGEETTVVEALAPTSDVQPGARVVVGWSQGQRVALALDPRSDIDAHRAADGIVRSRQRGRVQVELMTGQDVPEQTLLVAGCAPALSVLAERLSLPKQRIRFVHAPSLGAIDLLRSQHVQVAGIHVDAAAGEGNAELVARQLHGRHHLLVNLAVWEQGLVVAPGNPLDLRTATDLLRPDVRVAQRQPTAAAQLLLEKLVRESGGTLEQLGPLHWTAESHLEVARLVARNLADVGIATRSASEAYGLGFHPLTEEHFDLVIPREVASQEATGRFLDALRATGVRRELDSLGGYGTELTGTLIAEV